MKKIIIVAFGILIPGYVCQADPCLNSLRELFHDSGWAVVNDSLVRSDNGSIQIVSPNNRVTTVSPQGNCGPTYQADKGAAPLALPTTPYQDAINSVIKIQSEKYKSGALTQKSYENMKKHCAAFLNATTVQKLEKEAKATQ